MTLNLIQYSFIKQFYENIRILYLNILNNQADLLCNHENLVLLEKMRYI